MSSGVACSLIVDSGRDQCVSNDDCIGHGLAAGAVCVDSVCADPTTPSNEASSDAPTDTEPPDPQWDCVGAGLPAPASEKVRSVHFYAKFQQLSGRLPIEGLGVKLCGQLDVACSSPLDPVPAVTNDAGIVDLLVVSGFRGFMEIVPPSDRKNLMPSISYVQPTPDKADPPPMEPKTATTLLTKDELVFFSAAAGKEVSEENAHVLYAVLDCQGNFAAGVSLKSQTVTASTVEFYLDSSGNPDLVAKSTNEAGSGGYLNLPTGSVTLVASRLRRNGSRQEIAQQNVVVRKGTVTYTLFKAGQ